MAGRDGRRSSPVTSSTATAPRIWTTTPSLPPPYANWPSSHRTRRRRSCCTRACTGCRWRFPCPLVGFEERRPAQRTPLPGLVLAGDWTQTRMPCTMEGAVKSGFLAAEVVLADLGRPETLAIEARLYDGLAGVVRRVAAGRPRGCP
ncbi:FAD-dependent oxidoreductase [Massilia sp. Se16.2.3]|uniref:FAD-dependent oxidoreductase n=1 Tax=Massilia sp. Se16.2.3 TaxID=2709303 RepID=UPI00160481F0|nr:FAD-dependent oxidoreductase [Massilia sp. Se16.2.3]QNB00263.1 hypothetical protein G4G31_17960 [Massilia sp. Se16.2.3]